MQTLASCDAKITRTRTATRQSKGQFKGARAEGEHTLFAVLEYTLVLVSVAVPETKRPPPCREEASGRHLPLGRWMKVQGEFKMQAHITSGVVMDIAAFKVCHSVEFDKDATALRAARARSSSTSIGAMGEMLRKVQTANTHIL